MARKLVAVLVVLAIATGSVAVPSVAAGAADAAETPGDTETPDETANPAQTTTTPDDGPDDHADDPFPSWLPLLLAAGLLVGIAAVGGGRWFVFTRLRRFLGR